MSAKKIHDSAPAFEKLLANLTRKNYVLRLYITGATPQSVRAIANVRRICEQYLHGYYRLDVIDLYQQPELAQRDQVIAAPTLVKQLPCLHGGCWATCRGRSACWKDWICGGHCGSEVADL